MKKVKFAIDISEWELKAINDLRETTMKATAESLKYAFEGEHTYIYFPIEYLSLGEDGVGNTPVDDPLTVYLRVGLESGGEKPTFEFNLRECLKTPMESCAEDGSWFIGLEKLMHALHALADEIGVTLESIK